MDEKAKTKYIKQAFKNYNENKKALKTLAFESVKGINYGEVKTKKTNAPRWNENALIGYISQKETLEKQIQLVDRVLWWYKLDGGGRDEYIKVRYFKKYPLYRCAMELYAAQGTLCRWDKEFISLAKAAADLFNLY